MLSLIRRKRLHVAILGPGWSQRVAEFLIVEILEEILNFAKAFIEQSGLLGELVWENLRRR